MRTKPAVSAVILAACLVVAHEAISAQAGRKETSREVMLAASLEKGSMSVEEAISKRRSVRSFKSDALSMEELGQLLWAAQGITDKASGFRAAPSAGALYPLEVYAVTPEAVYKYYPHDHSLTKVKDGDQRKAVANAALGQKSVSSAPVSIVITAVYERTSRKYGARSERYVHVEAGCAAENVFLQAVAMGLGSVAVGAFEDNGVARAVGCPSDEKPLLVIPVGKPA